MKAFIGVTDHDWFQLLRSQLSIEEVNYCQTVFLLSGVFLSILLNSFSKAVNPFQRCFPVISVAHVRALFIVKLEPQVEVSL